MLVKSTATASLLELKNIRMSEKGHRPSGVSALALPSFVMPPYGSLGPQEAMQDSIKGCQFMPVAPPACPLDSSEARHYLRFCFILSYS